MGGEKTTTEIVHLFSTIAENLTLLTKLSTAIMVGHQKSFPSSRKRFNSSSVSRSARTLCQRQIVQRSWPLSESCRNWPTWGYHRGMLVLFGESTKKIILIRWMRIFMCPWSTKRDLAVLKGFWLGNFICVWRLFHSIFARIRTHSFKIGIPTNNPPLSIEVGAPTKIACFWFQQWRPKRMPGSILHNVTITFSRL